MTSKREDFESEDSLMGTLLTEISTKEHTVDTSLLSSQWRGENAGYSDEDPAWT